MRTALVAICSELDARYYVLEWIKYHRHIGFDDIFIYLNNVDKQTRNNLENHKLDYVHLIDWPGSVQQLPAYNDFIQKHNKEYDWCLMIDVDEFFVPNQFKDAKTALSHYKDYYGVGFNWKLFGSNGLEKADFSKGVIQRFTKSQKGLNQHIKTAINLKRCNQMYIIDDVMFMCPHFVGIAMRAYFTMRADLMKYVMGHQSVIDEYTASNWNKPYIAHYATKSREEFLKRRTKVRADTGKSRENLEEFWKEHNINEVENFDVLRFAGGPTES